MLSPLSCHYVCLVGILHTRDTCMRVGVKLLARVDCGLYYAKQAAHEVAYALFAIEFVTPTDCPPETGPNMVNWVRTDYRRTIGHGSQYA